MNAGNVRKCAALAAEDLVLCAYGETDDPRIARHVAACPDCRAFIADLEEIRAAARAGTLEPGPAVVAGLKARAARQARAGGTADRRREGARAWRWALAAAAVLVAAAGLMIYRPPWRQNVRLAAPKRSVPAYLAGVGGQISELEGLVGDSVDAGGLGMVEAQAGDSVAADGDFSLDPGVWDLIVEPGQDVRDLELAMNDLESPVDLLGDEGAPDGGAVEKGSGGEGVDLPLLRGIEDRASL